MASVWTYSGWINLDDGSAARLTQLRLHIQEVSDFISSGNYTMNGRSIDKDSLQKMLETLMKKEEAESKQVASSNGNRSAFTSGRMLF